MKTKHFATISDDLIVKLDNIPAWKQELLNKKGKRVYITVTLKGRGRSSNQNAYAYGVVYRMISDKTGMSPEEVKSALQIMFLKENKDGIEYVRNTSDLDTREFEEFLSKCRQWSSEFLELYVPLPNEVEY
jgi:hypothetical protein